MADALFGYPACEKFWLAKVFHSLPSINAEAPGTSPISEFP